MNCLCSRRGFLTALLCAPSIARADFCPSPPKASISVTTFAPAPAWHVADRDALATRYDAGAGGLAAVSRHGMRPAGLTTATFEAIWNIEVARVTIADRPCAALTAVKVEVRLKDHESYIAAEFSDAQHCANAIVRAHEARHAEINAQVVHAAAAQIRRTLVSQATDLPSVDDGGSAMRAIEIFSARIQPQIDRSFRIAVDDGNRQHAFLDSDYSRNIEWRNCAVVK